MARYEMNKTGKDVFSVLDKKTGKYVVINEGYQICANTEYNLNHGSDVSGCGEIADSIRELTAYEITYENGQSTRTSMAAGVTLKQAKEYFIGKRFDLGAYPQENMQAAIQVKKLA